MPNETGDKPPQEPREHPAQLGGFEIIEVIGKGGMGTVYRARQVSMDRFVALKILSRRLSRSKRYVQRFVREARAAAKLNHPNIVQGIDVGQAAGCYYFAMEFIDGETAHDKLKREGPLGELDAARICMQIAKALQHAHERANIIHRDVKPQNILLAPGGVAKLADLGLARHTEQQSDPSLAAAGSPLETPDAATPSSLTAAGTTLGTPDYISPEQVRGEADLDGRCDIYALGATLYHLLAGRPAYAGGSANVVMAKHLTEPPPDLRGERPDVSPNTAAIVRRAMQKDKARRYQTAEAMTAALEVVLTHGGEQEAGVTAPSAASVTVASAGRPARPRRPLPVTLWVVAGALVAAVAITLALLPWGGGREVAKPPPVPGARPRERPRERPGRTPPPEPRKPGEATYKAAQKLVQERGHSPHLLIRPLRSALERCRGTEYEGQVDKLLADVITRARAKVDAELGELRARAARLLLQGKYADAVAVYDEVPEPLRFGKGRELFGAAQDRLLTEVNGAFRAKQKAARAAADAGDFGKAAAIMQEVAGWKLPDLTTRAEEFIAGLKAEQAEKDRRAKDAEAAAVMTYMGRALAALKGREYGRAAMIAGDAQQDKNTGSSAARFKGLRADVRLCESLWKEAEQRLRTMKAGESVRLRGIKRKFVKFENGIIVVAGMEPAQLTDMREADLFDLLAPAFDPGGDDPAPHLKRGLFYTFDGQRQLGKAQTFFDEAEKLGDKAGAARGRYYMALIGKIEPEQAAIMLLTGARNAAKKENWRTVLEKLDELEKHADTDGFKRSAVERTELMLLAAGRGKGLDMLFSGETALRDADAVTITYDLGRKGQHRDWRGGSPAAGGLRFTRQLRWNAGVKVSAVRLTVRFPGRVERTDLRLMCDARGGRPLATAIFGAFRGTRAYFLKAGRQLARKNIRPGAATRVAVDLGPAEATLTMDGARIARRDLRGAPAAGGNSIFLVSNGVLVEVTGVIVSGRLDLAWARKRLGLLAELAEAKLLRTIKVPADEEWTDTGITLVAGRHYHLSATGRWQYGRVSFQGVSAAGMSHLRRGMPAYSLIGKSEAGMFTAGEEAVIGPHSAGRLMLGINDQGSGLRDNSGALTVEIRQLPPPPVPRYEPGLTASFYDGTNFERLRRRTVSPLIYFRASALQALAGQREKFSVRWEGYLKIPATNTYELGFAADDGFRMWLDGKKVFDEWQPGLRKGAAQPLRLTKGYHIVKVEYFQASGDARVSLHWRRAGGKGEPIPASAFLHSAAQK